MLILTIGGSLGRDPETRQTQGGTDVTNFSVAVSGYDFKAKEKTTTWVKVAMFGTRGTQLGAMLSKGDRVMASGEARLVEYNGKTSLELTANSLCPMGAPAGKQQGAPPPRQAAGKPKQAADDFPEDQIPF